EWERPAGRRGSAAAPMKPSGRGDRPPVRRRAGPPDIDRTPKLFIGGKQVRPDGGYSITVSDPAGRPLAEVARGNRKDIRNAVEAARKAQGWARATAHTRAQVLYYIAENLGARAREFAARLVTMTGARSRVADQEVQATIRRLFSYAAWADKWDGQVHHTPYRNVTLAMPEPLGVTAIVCPDQAPLLSLISLAAPAVAMGNTAVVVPSQRWPLSATDFYQVLETSDLPDGVINIVTGERPELSAVLAAHDDVDAMWCFGAADGGAEVERLSAGNLKRTWVDRGVARDWHDPVQGEGWEFLREATQVKNIWIPYGE
ncbi:MAG TPA: aldehyde dehydrogenase, partial [Gemmatimonadales bacterium]|nr:aldehyde dehydrogenase [Gemmatimonadales bacterium]